MKEYFKKNVTPILLVMNTIITVVTFIKLPEPPPQYFCEPGKDMYGNYYGIIILIISFIYWGDSGDSPAEHSQETKVVGTYKECDIIQWHYGSLSEYKYFLYCPNEREI